MIFIGDGALLRRAVAHTLGQGHTVDLVCSDDPFDSPDSPHLTTADVNAVATTLTAAATDGIVWSINNRRILRAPLLSSGLRFYNIHNGLLPAHRGIPAVAVLFALLRGDTAYGATLHGIEEGIDTGPVLAERRFAIGTDDRFHQVMLRGVRACHALFEQTLAAVVRGGTAAARAAGPGAGRGGVLRGRRAGPAGGVPRPSRVRPRHRPGAVRRARAGRGSRRTGVRRPEPSGRGVRARSGPGRVRNRTRPGRAPPRWRPVPY